MTPNERFAELHMCLETAVDQLADAQRLVLGASDEEPLRGEIERLFGEVTRLRNRVRDQLLNQLGRRAP